MTEQDKTKTIAPKAGGRGARFATAMDDAAAALNASVDFDRRLLREDARGSQAHARMLAAVGLISADDAKQIVAGLDQVVGEFERGERTMDPALEDVHMNVENRLIELIGDAGRRLHTARSRNDQVATDLRLYALSSAAAIVVAIDKARVALCRRAREHTATLLPGYTHLQRAQAVTLGHHLLAYAEMLSRDRGRFLDAARRASECPLGSGALAATSLPINREQTTDSLGFATPTRNSLDAVSDRDFCAELAFACAQLGVHLSRLGEELVLWSTTEFGFVRLGEGHCSGSSLMPQKRNPDIAELMRAKPGRLIGDVVALLTVSKGIALAYNKDLQETQEPFYDAIETTRLVLEVLPRLIAGLEFNAERMKEAANDPALGATDLAEHLVREGLPFRRAHEIVGKLVRHAEQMGVSIRDVPEHDLPQIAPELTLAALQSLSPRTAVAGRAVIGGPAPSQVTREVQRLAAELKGLGYEV
jgi:argininosuccinate lyase